MVKYRSIYHNSKVWIYINNQRMGWIKGKFFNCSGITVLNIALKRFIQDFKNNAPDEEIYDIQIK